MRRFKLRIKDKSDREGDTYEQIQKKKFIDTLMIASAPVFIYYTVHTFNRGLVLEGILTLICALILTVGFFMALVEFGKTTRDTLTRVHAYLFFAAMLSLHVSLACKGELHYAGWFFVFPLLTFYILGKKDGLLLSAIYIGCIGTALLFVHRPAAQDSTTAITKTHLLFALVTMTTFLFIYERARLFIQERLIEKQSKLQQSEKILRASKERSEKLAAKLVESNRELEKAIARANAKAQEARKANRAKSDFLANMSHELRTPLNHIIGFTEIVADQHFGPLNETQVDYLGDVLHSSHHLLELVNDILDLSKVEAGKLALECRKVALKPLLENSLVMVKEKAHKHEISLQIQTNGLPIAIHADERKLKQILYNLLSNAVKFTPDGGAVTLAAKRVEDEAGSWGEDAVLLSVSDTGIGIRAEDLQTIFNPFEQVDGSLQRKYQGTGLGLSLTKRLVGLHGGTIWAESAGEDQGSAFHCRLPVRPLRKDRLPRRKSRPSNREPLTQASTRLENREACKSEGGFSAGCSWSGQRTCPPQAGMQPPTSCSQIKVGNSKILA
jgi:signal transduction histidine kinase